MSDDKRGGSEPKPLQEGYLPTEKRGYSTPQKPQVNLRPTENKPKPSSDKKPKS